MSGTVRLFCQPDCAKCATVRRWLDRLGLEVQVTDVTTDESAQRELGCREIRSLPVVVTPDGKAAWGVERERLSAALPCWPRRRPPAGALRPRRPPSALVSARPWSSRSMTRAAFGRRKDGSDMWGCPHAVKQTSRVLVLPGGRGDGGDPRRGPEAEEDGGAGRRPGESTRRRSKSTSGGSRKSWPRSTRPDHGSQGSVGRGGTASVTAGRLRPLRRREFRARCHPGCLGGTGQRGRRAHPYRRQVVADTCHLGDLGVPEQDPAGACGDVADVC